MSWMHLEVDDEALAEAAEALGTEEAGETVNAALRLVARTGRAGVPGGAESRSIVAGG